MQDGRPHFLCEARVYADVRNFSLFEKKLTEAGFPSRVLAELVCDADCKNGTFPVSRENIKKETKHSDFSKSSWIVWSALNEDME